jgi:hypothetical protein
MKYLNNWKVFESFDDIKSNVIDLLRDSVIDEELPLKVKIGDFTNTDGGYLKVIDISIGNDFEYNRNIKVENIKDDIQRTVDYLESEGFSNFRFHFSKLGDPDDRDTAMLRTQNGFSLDSFNSIDFSKQHIYYLIIWMEKPDKGPYVESIKVPIEVGDTVLGGRFKNKKVVVKKIGKNKKGDITINDKPLLKFRTIKEAVDIDYYLEHLGDDNFYIQKKQNTDIVSNDEEFIRIFKPTKFKDGVPTYSYLTCTPFHWDDIEGDILRFLDEVKFTEIYIVYKDGNSYDRAFVTPDELENFNKELISIAIYYHDI